MRSSIILLGISRLCALKVEEEIQSTIHNHYNIIASTKKWKNNLSPIYACVDMQPHVISRNGG